MGSSIQLPVVGLFYLPIVLTILFLMIVHGGSAGPKSKFWLPLQVFLTYILFTTVLAVLVSYSGVSSNGMVLIFLVLQYLSPWPIFLLIVFLHHSFGDPK